MAEGPVRDKESVQGSRGRQIDGLLLGRTSARAVEESAPFLVDWEVYVAGGSARGAIQGSRIFLNGRATLPTPFELAPSVPQAEGRRGRSSG
jgi:hypothetical protein